MSNHQVLWSKTLFWEPFTYETGRKVPLTEPGEAHESVPPYRWGDCRFLRLPFSRRAVAFGRWKEVRVPFEDEDGPILHIRSMEWVPELFGGLDVQEEGN